MKSIAIYYRVSTDKQELQSQKKSVEDWLAALPEDKRPLRQEIFEDEGISGSTSKRPGYQNLLADAATGKFDTIVVYRLDRFSRNASEAIQTLLSLDEIGVGFISVTQPVLNLGHENPFRRTMLAAFAEIAEIERQTIVTRVKAGLEAAKKRGVKLGPPTKVTEQKTKDILQQRKEGKSIRGIANSIGLSYGAVQKILKSNTLS
ncbi:MAG: recombinase family protein [Pseudobacteriovorax sp.]|nr:recombinase family protein [Pseudobacteriovorax sp.]